MKKAVRLDKFLADAGAGTRSEVKKFIQKSRAEQIRHGLVKSGNDCSHLICDTIKSQKNLESTFLHLMASLLINQDVFQFLKILMICFISGSL